MLQFMEINRGRSPDPRHSSSPMLQDPTDFELSRARPTPYGRGHVFIVNRGLPAVAAFLWAMG